MIPPADSRVTSHRRPHRKSRNGCQQCKRMKIKCDECKPSCGRCSRGSFNCSFLDTRSTTCSASNIRETSSTSSQLSEVRRNLLPRNIPNSLAGSALEIHQGIGGLGLGVQDFELLHFYTTTTSFTVSNISERQYLWQQIVPQIAFSQHFLLHGILAISALHLARSQPGRKSSLFAKASAHHDVGLRLFRAATLNITRQNCDACFAFAAILVIYTWASSDQTGDLFFSDTSIAGEEFTVEWASLVRGMLTLLSAAREWIVAGSMKPTLSSTWSMDLEIAMRTNPEVSEKLTALSQLWNSSRAKFNTTDVEALNNTLALLHEAYGLIASSSGECQVDILAVALAWVVRLPETFLAMVKHLKPEALILLAHYSLVLNHLDQVWFMHGIGRHLVRTIHRRIEKKWEIWIAWLL